jgi:hypothetical protein
MFESEYVKLVIKPKIDLVLEDGVESIGDLTAKFNEAFDCKVSKSRITEWLRSIGYRVTRTVQITGREPAPVKAAPARAPVHDEFRTVHAQQSFNFPPPAAVFSNVRMPGFEE